MNKYSLLFIALLAGLIIRLCISWQNIETLITKVLTDDTLYVFKIAENIAYGKGITFDGITQTNGISDVLHPFLISPIFRFFSSEIEIHVVLTLLSIFGVGTAFLIFKIVNLLGSENVGLLAASIWLFNPYVILMELTGLGTSIYVFFLALSVFFYLKIRINDQYTTKNIFILGILLGITILSRTEGILLLFVIFLDIFYKLFWKTEFKVKSILKPFILGVTSFLVISPWIIWNLVVFNSFIQTSAQANTYIKRSYYLLEHGSFFSLSSIASHVHHMIDQLISFILADTLFSPIVIGLILGISFLWILKHPEDSIKLRNLNFLFLFGLLIFIFYSFYMYGTMFWYYLSFLLISILYTGLGIDLVFKSSKIDKRKLGSLFFIIFIVLFAFNGAFLWDQRTYTQNTTDYEMALWIDKNIPNDAIIGGFDTGILGYYSNRTSINLDGIVNNDAAKAIREGSMLKYILESDISYISLKQEENYIIFFGEGECTEFFSHLTEVHRIKTVGCPHEGDVILYEFIRK